MLNYLPTQVAYFEHGGWPEVPKVKKLEPGKSDPPCRRSGRVSASTGELAMADMAIGDHLRSQT